MLKSFFVVTVISFLFIGCASHEPIPTNSLKLKNNNQQEFSGIIIKNKAFVDKEELDRHYDIDTLEYGVLPVKVYVKNKTDKPVDLKVENMKLILEDGKIITPMDKFTAYERLKKNTAGRALGWGLAFGVIGIATSAITASSANDKIGAWLDSIMLKDIQLTPTDDIEGELLYAYSIEAGQTNEQSSNEEQKNKRDLKGAKLQIHTKDCECEVPLNAILTSK